MEQDILKKDAQLRPQAVRGEGGTANVRVLQRNFLSWKNVSARKLVQMGKSYAHFA
jgi:hypothetical protein